MASIESAQPIPIEQTMFAAPSVPLRLTLEFLEIVVAIQNFSPIEAEDVQPNKLLKTIIESDFLWLPLPKVAYPLCSTERIQTYLYRWFDWA